jgi:myo-inositol-1(or 4)-monophosphatase
MDTGSGRTCLVDPLDGSNNVAIGLPAYVVGIGLCVGAPRSSASSTSRSPAAPGTPSPDRAPTTTTVRGCAARTAASPAPGPCSPGPRDTPWTAPTAPRPPCAAPLEPRCRCVLQLWAPLLGWSLLARGTIDGFVGYGAEGVDLPPGALPAAEAGAELRTLRCAPFRPRFSGPDSGRSFVAARAETLSHVLEEVAAALRTT